LSTAAGCKKDQAETPGNVAEKKPAETPPPVKAACKFEWLDVAKSLPMSADVFAAFEQELQPDSPSSDPAVSVYPLKRIVRLARCGDAVLVVLGKSSPEKKRQDWDRPFELYDFNLATKQKTAIMGGWVFWLLQFGELAHFEDSDVPDNTFTSLSCTECEPLTMLSSVRFDPGLQKWELRKWPKDQDGISLFASSFGTDGSAALELPGKHAESPGLSATIGWQSAGWQELPPVPAYTATVTVTQIGAPEALAARGGTLTVWRLPAATSAGRWTLAQTVHVTIPYGSSG